MLKRLLKQDWDAIAGILAAIIALILHLLHYTDIDTLLAIAIVLMVILLLRDFRRESQSERIESATERNALALEELKRAVHPSDVTLIGPTELRSASLEFAQKSHGEVVFYNVCMRMYKAQPPFNVMLKPFIENPGVTSIRLVLDIGEKEHWQSDVLPKINACTGYNKVEEPFWCKLKDPISFVIGEMGSKGESEALVSFWGEPFMAIGVDKNVPRYVLHLSSTSEMVARLKEKERICRL
jgi:hypothetical protein